MHYSPSPLETLAAFAIVFVAGALSSVALSAYIQHLRKAGPHDPHRLI